MLNADVSGNKSNLKSKRYRNAKATWLRMQTGDQRPDALAALVEAAARPVRSPGPRRVHIHVLGYRTSCSATPCRQPLVTEGTGRAHAVATRGDRQAAEQGQRGWARASARPLLQSRSTAPATARPAAAGRRRTRAQSAPQEGYSLRFGTKALGLLFFYLVSHIIEVQGKQTHRSWRRNAWRRPRCSARCAVRLAAWRTRPLRASFRRAAGLEVKSGSARSSGQPSSSTSARRQASSSLGAVI